MEEESIEEDSIGDEVLLKAVLWLQKELVQLRLRLESFSLEKRSALDLLVFVEKSMVAVVNAGAEVYKHLGSEECSSPKDMPWSPAKLKAKGLSASERVRLALTRDDEKRDRHAVDQAKEALDFTLRVDISNMLTHFRTKLNSLHARRDDIAQLIPSGGSPFQVMRSKRADVEGWFGVSSDSYVHVKTLADAGCGHGGVAGARSTTLSTLASISAAYKMASTDDSALRGETCHRVLRRKKSKSLDAFQRARWHMFSDDRWAILKETLQGLISEWAPEATKKKCHRHHHHHHHKGGFIRRVKGSFRAKSKKAPDAFRAGSYQPKGHSDRLSSRTSTDAKREPCDVAVEPVVVYRKVSVYDNHITGSLIKQESFSAGDAVVFEAKAEAVVPFPSTDIDVDELAHVGISPAGAIETAVTADGYRLEKVELFRLRHEARAQSQECAEEPATGVRPSKMIVPTQMFDGNSSSARTAGVDDL